MVERQVETITPGPVSHESELAVVAERWLA